jgi:hypothetical protein
MNPPTNITSPNLSTVQSGAYDSYGVLALGPCNKASEIFQRHTDALCFGEFTGQNTSYVNYTPLSVTTSGVSVPTHTGSWGTPFHDSSSPKQMFAMGSPNFQAAMMAKVPGIAGVPATCKKPAYDPTLAPSTTYKSYGTYTTNPNAGNKPCGMVNQRANC